MRPMKIATAAAALLLFAFANAFAQSGKHTFVLPYLGSAPETGLQYGATIFRVTQPKDSLTRPSTAQLFASYTTKSQARAFAEVDRWTSGNLWHLTTHLEWERFPLPYYGMGDSTPSSAEELFTPRGFLASAVVQRRVRGPVYASVGYRFQDLKIQTARDGSLRSGTIPGSRGGRVGQLQGAVLLDSRDDVFAPERGTFAQLTGSVAAREVGSEFKFRRAVMDARQYLLVGTGRVIALQGVLESTGGVAPFDQISLVGSSNYLRGYARGRYRDRALASLQAEYRAHLWRRMRWATFAGAGRVAPRLAGVTDSDARTLLSYGAGLRWKLFADSRSAIRVDYARGSAGNSGLYVSLNEAF